MKRLWKEVRRMVRRHDVRLFCLSALILFSGAVTLWAATLRIPDLGSFDERKVKQSTKIYDRTDEILLYDLHENIQRTVVPFDAVSRDVKNATVAIEDATFYEHAGVRPLATLRAVFLQPLRGKGVQGGSTITQQVVKNSLLTTEKKISRKIKEWVLSLKIERVLSKDGILTLYLNESPYGGSIYGIEEASKTFFDKHAKDVTLAEAAYLAALPQAPTFYSPYGNNRDKLEERKNLVLRRMRENNFITDEEYEAARTEEVIFQPQRERGMLAPHFVMMVRQYLEETYGQRAIEERGFKVTTTLNYELQERAEEIVNRHALENKEKFNAENAALVAVDPKTGQILTMVGSRDYFDADIDGAYNVTTARPGRQPGSAFKPFVYATAFKKGYTPETVVFDLKTQFSTNCNPTSLNEESPCYSPNNYDNVFRGPVSLKNALAQSINIPAVKVLYLAGIKNALRTARDMGIEGLGDANRYGLTLVLGGGEVTPLEMAGAYGVFANRGVRNQTTFIVRIEDASGGVVEEFAARPSRVLDENIALQVTDILADNEARSPAFGEQSYLYFPGRDVAAKTGTTNDYRDAWIIGYTPSVAAAAWAGNNDNTPMEKKVAGFIVAPLWHEFMDVALSTFSDERFDPPRTATDGATLKPILRGVWQGGRTYVIDTVSGKLATDYTPEEAREERVVRNVHSILHWVSKDDPRGPAPIEPRKDPQYPYWEYAVRLWASTNGYTDETESVIPTTYDDAHRPGSGPLVALSGVKTAYRPGDLLTVSVTNTGASSLMWAEFFLNGVYLGRVVGSAPMFSFVPSDVGIAGLNTLRIIASDNALNKTEVETHFSVSL